MAIIFNNIVSYAGGGKDVLSPGLVDIIDQASTSYELNNNITDKMGFVETRALTPTETFGLKIGAYALDKIVENQDFPVMKVGYGNQKGFEVIQYGNTIPLTRLFRKWLEKATSLDGADTSVQKEFASLRSNVKLLLDGARKRMNMEATKVFTNGWALVKPNDATPYGMTLFSTTHPYAEGTLAFQNVLGGAYGILDKALDFASLQAALNLQKSGIRLQNGDLVETPGNYTLMVSRLSGTAARVLLNTRGTVVGQFSGTGANSTQLNQFNFEGNTVELIENPYLGFNDIRSGEVIGTQTMWFLINTEAMKEAKALRKVMLMEPEVRIYDNNSTGTTYTNVDCAVDFIHVGAEYYVVGSKGTA